MFLIAQVRHLQKCVLMCSNVSTTGTLSEATGHGFAECFFFFFFFFFFSIFYSVEEHFQDKDDFTKYPAQAGQILHFITLFILHTSMAPIKAS